MWEELYERHYRELSGFARRMSGSPELGEDLVQDTFLRALQNPGILEDLTPSKQRAWLYRTLKNLYLTGGGGGLWRRLTWKPSGRSPSGTAGFRRLKAPCFCKSWSLWTRPSSSCVFEEGCTAREIGEMLNLPPGTVRSRLSRCRKYLKENLE